MARAPAGPRAVAAAPCFGHYLRARRQALNNKTITGALLEE